MHSVFEVGKKVKLNFTTSGHSADSIHDCLFVGDSIVILRSEKGCEWCLTKRFEGRFNRYIGPKKEYFNAYKGYNGIIHYGNPYTSQALADKAIEGNDYYGRLIMTHHSETEVTVEFHLKR